MRGISNTVYETVCAFLNAKGGDILLGVKDNAEILSELPKNIFLQLNKTSLLL
ncbi:MAG: ATP-binding protein [Endomicrobium sp.]|nr:ATP-binding protein [Endomicrobium sp.]